MRFITFIDKYQYSISFGFPGASSREILDKLFQVLVSKSKFNDMQPELEIDVLMLIKHVNSAP